MTGCIYAFAGFWICNIVLHLCDATGYHWYYNGTSVPSVIPIPGFVSLIFAALSTFAFHQTWEVAYPPCPKMQAEQKAQKPNHENHNAPFWESFWGWLTILIVLAYSVGIWWAPDTIAFHD